MAKVDLEQKLRCLELAASLLTDNQLDVARIFDLSDQFVAYVEDNTAKPNTRSRKPSSQVEQIDLDDPERKRRIEELVKNLPGENRIVMRTILNRAQTDELEKVYQQYLPKL